MTDYRVTYEAKLIALMLIFPERISEITYITASEDFSAVQYRAAFDYIMARQSSGEFVDIVAVSELLEFAQSDTMSMLALAASETECVPTAKAIHDAARKRRVAEIAQAAIDATAITGQTSDTIIDEAVDGLHGLRVEEQRGRSETLPAAAASLYTWLISDEPDVFINTGFGRLDKLLGGMKPGNLVLLAARPAVGKSAFAANMAMNTARRGIKSVFFSCEMSTRELMIRYAANGSGVPLGNIAGKTLNESQARSISTALRSMSEYPMLIVDQPGTRVYDIRRELQAQKDVGLVVVDYIQLMQGSEKSENRNLEVAKISGDLKRLAKEFNIPILALSQLNRARDELDEPGLPDLRDSGSLEQDADKVIMLWLLEKPQKDAQKKIGVKVAKNRMGATGTVVMYFDGATMSFRETAEEYVPKRTKGRGRSFVAQDEYFPEGW